MKLYLILASVLILGSVQSTQNSFGSDEIETNSTSHQYQLHIWPAKSEGFDPFKTYVIVKIAPHPRELESFTENKTGFEIKENHFFVNEKIIRPDREELEYPRQIKQTFQPFSSQLFQEKGAGEYVVEIEVSWKTEGVEYYLKNSTKIFVKEPIFRSDNIQNIFLNASEIQNVSPLDWSNNGEKILFRFNSSMDSKNIGIMDISGKVLETYTIPFSQEYRDAYYWQSTSFSPSEQELIFYKDREVHSFDLKTLESQQIGKISNVEFFDMSVNGDLFYLIGGDYPYDVWKTDLNGKNKNKILSDVYFNRFSVNSDGAKLIFQNSEGIVQYDINSKSIENIPNTETWGTIDPQWAPNEDMIIFYTHFFNAHRGPSSGTITVTSFDGTSEQIVPLTDFYYTPKQFLVSPDGTKVIYSDGFGNPNLPDEQPDFFIMTLAKPIPEFETVAIIVLAGSLVPIILARKNLFLNIKNEN